MNIIHWIAGTILSLIFFGTRTWWWKPKGFPGLLWNTKYSYKSIYFHFIWYEYYSLDNWNYFNYLWNWDRSLFTFTSFDSMKKVFPYSLFTFTLFHIAIGQIRWGKMHERPLPYKNFAFTFHFSLSLFPFPYSLFTFTLLHIAIGQIRCGKMHERPPPQ